MIRWSIQRGFVCIPKSANEERIKQNFDVFDFQLSESEMEKLVSVVYLSGGLEMIA